MAQLEDTPLVSGVVFLHIVQGGQFVMYPDDAAFERVAVAERPDKGKGGFCCGLRAHSCNVLGFVSAAPLGRREKGNDRWDVKAPTAVKAPAGDFAGFRGPRDAARTFRTRIAEQGGHLGSVGKFRVGLHGLGPLHHGTRLGFLLGALVPYTPRHDVRGKFGGVFPGGGGGAANSDECCVGHFKNDFRGLGGTLWRFVRNHGRTIQLARSPFQGTKDKTQ